MNDTRRRMLTEYLGEEWEPFEVKEWEHFTKEYGKEYSAFPVEGVEPTIRFVSRKHRTFTTAHDMVDLGKRMMVNGDWNPFYCDTFNDWYARNRESVKNTEDADAKFVAWLLFTDPARTCELIAEWMEGKG